LTIKPLSTDGNPLHLSRDSSASNPIYIQDCDYIIDGEIPTYTGYKWGITNFARDTFGIVLDSQDDLLDQNNMIVKMAGASDGSATTVGIMRGVYVKHGFAAIRAFDDNSNTTDNELLIERCMIDAGASEGTYLGITSDSADGKPRTKHTFRDCIVAFRGSESLQMQHLLNNSIIENSTIYAGGIKFRDSFLFSQDSGIQIMPLESCTLRNVIVHGFGENGLIIFGDNGNGTAGTFNVNNLALFEARNKGVYLHNSTAGGVDHIFRDLYFLDGNETIDEPGSSALDDYVLENAGTDDVFVYGLTKDSVKTDFFQAAVTESHGLVNTDSLSLPNYIKSGFDGIKAEQIEMFATSYPFWSNNYGDIDSAASSDSGSTTTFTTDAAHGRSTSDLVTITDTTSYNAIYTITVLSATTFKISEAFVANETGNWALNIERKENDICIDRNDYYYYKCLGNYTPSTTAPPSTDATNWLLIRWDATGTRSDEAGYSSGTARNDPPNNFGLAANDYWNKRGFGCYNEPNSDYVYYKWIMADNDAGSNPNQIPNAHEYRLERTRFTQIEVGKYIKRVTKAPGQAEESTAWFEIT